MSSHALPSAPKMPACFWPARLPRWLALSVLVALLLPACGDDDISRTVDDGSNRAPVIDTLLASAASAAPGDTVELSVSAFDPDSDTLGVAWLAAAGELIGAGAEVRWRAPAEEGFHRIIAVATDTRGASARDTAVVVVDAFEGTLLVQTQGGLTAVDAAGNHFVFNDHTGAVEVLGDRIFLAGYRQLTELDHDGQEIGSVVAEPSVSGYTFVLPDGGFAAATNGTDLIYLVAPTGTVTDTLAMPNPSPDELQNVDGVVVGDRLIVSENGNNEVLAVDLATREISILRSVQDGQGWLGAIDYADGRFFLCRSQRIHTFTEGGALNDLCALPEYNITGIAVGGHFAYAVVNFGGALYRIDRQTGEYQRMLGELAYPQDIEILPVRLEPPGR